jgi:RNA polymerase sigma factor (sigma-70 family)
VVRTLAPCALGGVQKMDHAHPTAQDDLPVPASSMRYTPPRQDRQRSEVMADEKRLLTPQEASDLVVALMVKYEERLAKYFERKGLQLADALNASQDLFLKALSAASKWTTRPDSEEAWFFSMARLVARTYHRTQRRKEDREQPYPDYYEELMSMNPVDEASRIEICNMMAAAVDALPDSQWVVIKWCLVEGASQREVAETLSISRRAVSGRLKRATRALCRALRGLAADVFA